MAGLLGMSTMLLAGLNEPPRETAILQSVGARPLHVFALFVAGFLAGAVPAYRACRQFLADGMIVRT